MGPGFVVIPADGGRVCYSLFVAVVKLRLRAGRSVGASCCAEQAVIKAVRRAKLFVFLRLHRHELFDEEFQAELAQAYAGSPKGQPPVPPAQLALATILQAYTGVSDDEVIEATVMDRRWQLVLDCMDADAPTFAKGTLTGFRKRLIERDLDRALVERTVALAARTGGSARGRCGRRWIPARCGCTARILD
jgi:hypothetical protein